MTQNGNEKQDKNLTEEIEKANDENNISNNEKILKDNSASNSIAEKIIMK